MAISAAAKGDISGDGGGVTERNCICPIAGDHISSDAGGVECQRIVVIGANWNNVKVVDTITFIINIFIEARTEAKLDGGITRGQRDRDGGALIVPAAEAAVG